MENKTRHSAYQRYKEDWIKFLEGGEFEQGPGALKVLTEDEKPRHCCLGVLCESRGNYEVFDGYGNFLGYSTWMENATAMGIFKNDLTHSQVAKVLNLDDDCEAEDVDKIVAIIKDAPHISVGVNLREHLMITLEGWRKHHTTKQNVLMTLNDRGIPFDVIAKVIREVV